MSTFAKPENALKRAEGWLHYDFFFIEIYSLMLIIYKNGLSFQPEVFLIEHECF